MSVDRPLSRPLVVVKNAAQPLLYPLARPLVRSALYSTSALTRFAVNGVEAALALDFVGGEYRTANAATTFADAFMGNSPKLTYSTAAGSNSTMVNSEGKIVWAPHNLVDYSEDFSNAAWTKQGSTAIDSTLVTGPDGTLSGRRVLNFDDAPGHRLVELTTITNATLTGSIWVKGEGDNIGKDIQITVKRSGGTFAGASVSHTLTADWVRLNASFTQEPDNTGANFVLANLANGNEASEVLIYGAHLYRSDLGGMAPVPGAVGDFQYYVPTNGSAEYLPRVGHHVFNGSTWVNEGLLIESEARTNLIPDSNDPTTVNWFTKNTNASQNLTGPDGVANSGWTLEDDSASAYLQNRANIAISATTAVYTGSVFVLKDDDETRFPEFQLQATGGTQNIYFVQFNSATGATVVRQNVGGSNINVEDYGDWWRFSFAVENNGGNTTLSFKILPAAGSTWNTNSTSAVGSIGFYGAQLEVGEAIPNTNPVQYKDAPTPSSYMPTSGGTYTRTAQSLTVPPAEFGWPEPEYIGPNLVDNSEFDTDTTGWSGVNSTLSVVDQRLRVTNTGAFGQARSAAQTVEVGKVYQVTAKLVDRPAVANVPQVVVGTSSGGTQYLTLNGSIGATSFDFSGVFVATTTSVYISLLTPESTDYADWDNISVREINPLSVSIQMDGRMTYADEDTERQVKFVHWPNTSDPVPYIRAILHTLGSYTGGLNVKQYDGTALTSEIEPVSGSYSPGINVPFNIASRHGSTFINGAVDGVALDGTGWEYGDTTPTALPDLSNTDLAIAYDFMGTIGTFRQFAGDIGDTGLVTATNPSTEPTLSLTFDGTGGSFYNLSWSE